MGDRECLDCLEESLIEKGLTDWVCLICNRIYDERFLDENEE